MSCTGLLSFSFNRHFKASGSIYTSRRIMSTETQKNVVSSSFRKRARDPKAEEPLIEIAEKFVIREGESARCNIEPTVGCRFKHVQDKADMNNMVRHFRKRHPDLADSNGFNRNRESTPKKQRVIPKRPMAIDRQLLTQSTMKLVTYHNLPVTCLEWEGLKELLDPIAEALGVTLNSKTMKQHLSVACAKILDEIKEEMRNKLISLKIDSASKYHRHMLCINAQYAVDDKVVIRTLGILEVKERQTATCLKKLIMTIIESYGLTICQIFSITCDNGSNMLAAVKEMKKEFELAFDEEECMTMDTDPDDEKCEEFTSALSNELAQNLNLIRCAVHTQQLAILDVVKKTNESVRKITDVAKKCKLAKYKAEFELEKANYPPVWGQTRWCGIYSMMASFCEQRPFFLKLAERFPELDLADNWEFALQYEEAFRPLFLCTKTMQSNHISLADFYLQWLIAVQKVKQTSPNPFSARLVESLHNRLTNLKGSRAFQMALFIDPRLNYAGSTLFTPDEKAEIQSYIEDTWNRIDSLNKSTSISQEIGQSGKSSEHENDRMITELFGGSPTNTITSDEGSFLQQLKTLEVEQRRPFNYDVWQHWVNRKATHPEISAVASVVLAAPSNQVSVERAFSALGLVLTDSRSTLGEDTLYNILMIKLNKSIFDRIIPTMYEWKDNPEPESQQDVK